MDSSSKSAAEIETLTRLYAAINSNDVPAGLACFDPGIVRLEFEGTPMAGVFRGLEEMRENLSKGRSNWAEGACTPEKFVFNDGKILVDVHVRVRLKESTKWIDARVTDGYAFRDGKITQMNSYIDNRKAYEWAGIKNPIDSKTHDAYLEKAQAYSDDWLSQPAPDDMYALLKKHFVPGTVADIGCGNGRDAKWLAENGFKVAGFDASPELITIARTLFPGIEFRQAFLPALREIETEYDNVLCETVIMHLASSEISEALASLKRILKKDGTLYLSWRVTEGTDARHADGRLYAAFATDDVLKHFASSGVLHFEDKISQSSGKRVCRLLWRS